jgi:integrase
MTLGDAGNADYLALARAIRAHERAACAFSNSISSEFGWRAPIGRLADGQRFLNPIVASPLEDLSACRLDRSELAPTERAQMMLEHEHRRALGPAGRSRRLCPMPPAARVAVRAYLEERVALYEQAEEIFRQNKRGWYRREVRWHLNRLARISDFLAGAWS